MLQEYLNSNLLPITDEAQLTKLKKATDEVVKKLRKQKSKIITYTIIALDSETSSENADVLEVREIVIKTWSTFVTNTNDTPMPFIRAVIMEALELLSEELDFCNLIWQSARNIHVHFKTLAKEKTIIENFLVKLASKVETAAQQRNNISAQKVIADINLGFDDLVNKSVQKTEFLKKLQGAVGPTNSEGVEPTPSANPYWPNSGEAWAHQFTPRASTAITEIVNTALNEHVRYVNALQTKVSKAVKDIASSVNGYAAGSGNSSHLRTNLLWWKEAGYSKINNSSYRSQPSGFLEILLTVDYSDMVPLVTPCSVDYFLKEVHRTFSTDSTDSYSLEEILSLIAKCSTELQPILPATTEHSSRVSLLEFVKGLVFGSFNIGKFQQVVGFSAKTTKITLSDFTLWLFHDLQAEKLSKSK